MALPTTMRALVEGPKQNGSVEIQTIPVPELLPGEVIVKVDYVAQNPTDWKHAQYLAPAGAIIGCDFTGTVVASAAGNSQEHAKVGTRVSGIVHGGLFKTKGAFAEYTHLPAELCWPTPDTLSGPEGATYGVPFLTAFQALQRSQEAPWPPAKVGGWILIYGGSTAVGLMALQLAKLLGYQVISTCSPHNFDLVKSYGADVVVDYHDGDAAIASIKETTGGGVLRALDCPSLPDTQAFSVRCFGDKGGQLNVLLGADPAAQKIREDVKIVGTLGYTVMGEEFDMAGRNSPPRIIPAAPSDRVWGAELCRRTPEIITVLGIRAPPFEVRGGLDAIPQGFEDMKANKVSGKRLVYKVPE